MIHHRAIAHDKQSICAQIILVDENPRLSSLPRRRSDLTARYLPTDYRKLARWSRRQKKQKKKIHEEHDNSASCDNFYFTLEIG